MRVQLVGKWNHAAATYREQHPGVLPVQKSVPRHRPSKRLLPIAVANEKMAVWVSWAFKRVMEEAQELQAAQLFQQLDIAQQAQVDQEPDLDGSESD